MRHFLVLSIPDVVAEYKYTNTANNKIQQTATKFPICTFIHIVCMYICTPHHHPQWQTVIVKRVPACCWCVGCPRPPASLGTLAASIQDGHAKLERSKTKPNRRFFQYVRLILFIRTAVEIHTCAFASPAPRLLAASRRTQLSAASLCRNSLASISEQ